MAMFGDEDLDFSNLNFNDDQLNDPDLLAELAGLVGTEQVSTPKILKKKSDIIVDVNNILSGIPMEDPQVDDVDENDPNLLAELTAIAHDDVKIELPPANLNDSKPPQLAESFTIANPKEKIQLNGPDISKSLSNAPASKEADNEPNGPSPNPKLFESKVPTNFNELQPLHEEFESRIQEYQRAALHYKRANDIDSAKNMLRTAKRIQQEWEAKKSGPGNPSFILPPSPSLESNRIKREPPQEPLDTDALKQIFKRQIEECKELAISFFTLGDKAQAAIFHKLHKQMLKDQELLNSSRQGKIRMETSFVDQKYTLEEINKEIPVDELKLQILSGENIQIEGALETSVGFELMWPSESSSIRGETAKSMGKTPSTILLNRICLFAKYQNPEEQAIPKIHRTKEIDIGTQFALYNTVRFCCQ